MEPSPCPLCLLFGSSINREMPMAYRLAPASLALAIKHLCTYGDTDVFPHLPEIHFLRHNSNAVAKELANVDLDSYSPGGAVEALAPKSKLGFRIAHQLPLHDTILLLAAVIDIGAAIESRRPSATGIQAFSYRFQPDSDGRLFLKDHTFKAWLNSQLAFVQSDLKIKRVIFTDISDFYARINFHRLENLLDETAPKHGAVRFIKKHIKTIRATQSFGLPVGGSAARLLSELALVDTDGALQQEGYVATRFVDDFRIFIGAHDNPYDVLSLLAEQLGINEGLSLNTSKTVIYERAEFIAYTKGLVTDVSEEAEGEALEQLTSDLYFDDQHNPDDVEKLKSLNLLGYLQDEIGKEPYDMGRIKVIFRALKIAKPTSAISYLSTNFTELVVFAKEITLLMQALEADTPNCFDDLDAAVLDAILSPPAASVQVIRTWLLELFVRGVVPVPPLGPKRLEGLSSILDKRQLHLIRGRLRDQNFFRRHKTAFDQLPPFEQSCFVIGASCLPDDEYGKWLQTAKALFDIPTGPLLLSWAKSRRASVLAMLRDELRGDHEPIEL